MPCKVSLIVATLSAILATALGSLAGVALARRPGKWALAFLFLVALVLVTPEIVDAIALAAVVRLLGQDMNLVSVRQRVGAPDRQSLGFSTAVVALIVRARLAGIDESLEEAAGDLYATPTKRFTQITLPLMLPAVLAGACCFHPEPGQHRDLVVRHRAGRLRGRYTSSRRSRRPAT